MSIWTIDRLVELKPGERFVFYRGDFNKDISKESPYCSVLAAVKDAAANLERQGRIHVEVREVRINHNGSANTGRKSTTFEYVAVGREPTCAVSDRIL